jgi:signal transduction histidine kinase
VLRQESERENGSRETMLACIDTLLLASKHAAEVSDKLTKFGRKGESAFVQLNVHDILNNVMGIAKSIAGSNITVRTIMSANDPVITGSETMLQNALFNVVVNAFDAMKNGGGALTVETADVTGEIAAKSQHATQLRRGSYLLISVRDTGIGMDEEVKGKLFDPFFTTHAEKGLGLGLVSFRECVRSHGGLIEIHSEPGKGARFDIYLPRPE